MRYMTLFLLPILVAACEDRFFEPEPGNHPEALFEELWGTFDEEYACFEERNVDWQEVYFRYRPQIHPNSTQDELYQVYTKMLRMLNDGHVVLIAPGKDTFKSNIHYATKKPDSLFNARVVRSEYLTSCWKNGEGGNLVGEIGHIGYWHIQWIGENLLETNAILDFFRDKEGLIIDLRNNWGGDFTYGITEFGRFTESERLVFRSKTKNGPGTNDFGPWYSWTLDPVSPHFNKQIVLITDRYTISAGERIAMILKSLPNVIHVGDTTNGALSTKIGKELSNGWYYSMAPQKVVFADGVAYEGTGLIPDVYSKNSHADLKSGRDLTLEFALNSFR